MFSGVAACLLILGLVTLVTEYRRVCRVTLLSVLTLGNMAYGALTPAIYHFSPESASIFGKYVQAAGMSIQDAGLLRVMLAAVIFQAVCCMVALRGRAGRDASPARLVDPEVISRSIAAGWALMFVGAFGVVWMGMVYSGSPIGLYEISYADRSGLSRQNSIPAFMLLLGVMGASQLIVVYLLADRTKMAVLVLLLITLHGLGMKSKFPVFMVLLVFLAVVVGKRKNMVRLLLPMVVAGALLMTMSVLRDVDRISDIPGYVSANREALKKKLPAPWQNDVPGPASINYFVLNSDVPAFSPEPAAEVFKLLVPRFIRERGDTLADQWAQKMLGSSYQPGMGFGWSPLCEGYLLANWFGIAVVAFVLAMVARSIDGLRDRTQGKLRELSMIVAYSCVPLLFLVSRESMGALVKHLVFAGVFVWLPTWLLLARKGWLARGGESDVKL
jgi:hypothetical protein